MGARKISFGGIRLKSGEFYKTFSWWKKIILLKNDKSLTVEL